MAKEPLPYCRCCVETERIYRDTDPIYCPPSDPASLEFDPVAFSKCTFHPMKRKGQYMGCKSDEAMAHFCKWFKPTEKGIKLDYKGNTLQFIINYPKTPNTHGFCVYVVTLPSAVAKAVAGELKKKDRGSPSIPTATYQMGRVIGNHLVVIFGGAQYDKIMRGILENITDFMDFQ